MIIGSVVTITTITMPVLPLIGINNDNNNNNWQKGKINLEKKYFKKYNFFFDFVGLASYREQIYEHPVLLYR